MGFMDIGKKSKTNFIRVFLILIIFQIRVARSLILVTQNDESSSSHEQSSAIVQEDLKTTFNNILQNINLVFEETNYPKKDLLNQRVSKISLNKTKK